MRRFAVGLISIRTGLRATLIAVLLTAFGAKTASAAWYDTYDFSSKGIVAYWPFDGDSTDKSRNGNNGTWNGGGFAPAVLGQGYEFSSDTFYQVPGNGGSGLHAFTAFTMAAWFKLASDPIDNESLLGAGLDGQPGHAFLFIMDSFGGTDARNAFGFNATTNSNATMSVPAAEIPNSVGQWHHLAITWDGTTTKTYLDGVLATSGTTASGSAVTIPISEPFYINRHNWASGSSSRLSGIVDEVVIAQRALSATEIAALATDANSDGIADFWIGASAPSPDFSWSPATPVSGQAVQFTDRSTGNPTSWLWSFGDGTTSTAQNPTHTYAVSGVFTATIQACRATACGTKTQTLTVAPSVSVGANFTWTPQPPTAGQQVQFTDTSTGNPTSWSWSFGDGTTSTAQNPTHVYTNAGTYTVTETAAANGVTSTISHAVDVRLPANCFTPSISLPIDKSGHLSPSCVSIDLRGHLAKFFAFSVQAPTMLAARLSLSTVDAHLSLLAGNNEFGRVLASDERSGGGSPATHIPYAARLSRTLAPGTYTLEVTTAAPVSTAASYRLQANIAQPMVEQFADQKTFVQRWKRSDYQNKCKPQEPCPIPPNGGTTFDPNKVNTRTTGLVTLLLQGNKGAEMVSVRDDFHYGKYFFLAAAPDTQRLKSPQGSVFGLFTLQKNQDFKRNEIDVELLTRWYDPAQARLVPAPGTVFFATHDGVGTLSNLSPSVLLGRAVWYGFDWTPTSVTFYVFANNHGRIGSQLAMRTIYSSPTDETIIVINTWAGNINYGGTYPTFPVYSAIYQVQYYPAFFQEVSAAP